MGKGSSGVVELRTLFLILIGVHQAETMRDFVFLGHYVCVHACVCVCVCVCFGVICQISMLGSDRLSSHV